MSEKYVIAKIKIGGMKCANAEPPSVGSLRGESGAAPAEFRGTYGRAPLIAGREHVRDARGPG